MNGDPKLHALADHALGIRTLSSLVECHALMREALDEERLLGLSIIMRSMAVTMERLAHELLDGPPPETEATAAEPSKVARADFNGVFIWAPPAGGWRTESKPNAQEGAAV